MIKTCPTSCGLCKPTCKDAHEDCAGWTASGACGENPNFMLKVRAPHALRSPANHQPTHALLSCRSARCRAASARTSAWTHTMIAPAGRPTVSATRTPVRGAAHLRPPRRRSPRLRARLQGPAADQSTAARCCWRRLHAQDVPQELRGLRAQLVRRQEQDAVRRVGQGRVPVQPGRDVPRLRQDVRATLLGLQGRCREGRARASRPDADANADAARALTLAPDADLDPKSQPPTAGVALALLCAPTRRRRAPTGRRRASAQKIPGACCRSARSRAVSARTWRSRPRRSSEGKPSGLDQGSRSAEG